MRTGTQWAKMKKGGHLEDPSVYVRVILKWILSKWDGRAWTESIWLRIRTGGRLLYMG